MAREMPVFFNRLPAVIKFDELWLFFDEWIFDGFTHGEVQGFSGRDVHDFIGFRIFGNLGLALPHLETSKTADFNATIFHEGLYHGFQDNIHCLADIFFKVAIQLFGDLNNKILFEKVFF